MGSERDIAGRATTRAWPLPEEAVAEHGEEDRQAEAEGILRDSEDRVAAASATDRPADAADEHRRSEETSG